MTRQEFLESRELQPLVSELQTTLNQQQRLLLNTLLNKIAPNLMLGAFIKLDYTPLFVDVEAEKKIM